MRGSPMAEDKAKKQPEPKKQPDRPKKPTHDHEYHREPSEEKRQKGDWPGPMKKKSG
jgi:hypothetical protein